MRPVRVVAAAVCVALALAPGAAAASPGGGNLVASRRTLTWTGGPFWASQPNYAAPGCALGAADPTCDHFALTVSLGNGARVEVSIATPSPNPDEGAQPLDGDDYDLFVYSPDGKLVAEAANNTGNETLRFTHLAKFNGRPYEIRVAPWFVMPGSTYRGTVTALSLGR